MKSKSTIFWVIGVSVVAITVFIYIILADTPRTLPKIKLSYFTDEAEIAVTVEKRLFQETNQNKFYWIGIEPEKNEQLAVVAKLKQRLDKKIKFQNIIVDEELNLSKEVLAELGTTDTLLLKENLTELGEKLQLLETNGTPYLLITASIYTNSFLRKNPVHLLREKNKVNPVTFSLAYLSTTPEDERKMLFPCSTEDHSGLSDWGCIVVNKSRISRRRMEFDNPKPWLGLMDLSGEKDYILLLKKK